MKVSLIFILFGVMSLIYQPLNAQHQFSVSLFPGYNVINNDQPTSKNKQTNWVFGGTISFDKQIKNQPLSFSLSYLQGKSTIFKIRTNIGPVQPNYEVLLRYQTIPIEAFYVHSIGQKTELLTGINFTPQYRTLLYERINIKNDRLLSLGFGLSGKVKTDFATFNGGQGVLFGSVAARWTEFLFHHANGRNVDDFSLRHVVVSPQIGMSWNLN
ncbi:hypothetical protein [Gracilimonas mengyeensis]|uniref:Outer membrane protein beta-barrel domain-containing protein n=1 Tax=Gracilimonas mengyeensis TaxID=1302730 RepID=A0A521D4Q3_9BACT|nr:hypothetical protein [Gracilimonas mengyeensis]SMO66696.1 hypothetical protein SAMN06265219_107111 [Gracilimonas mengyeensis]